MTMSGYVAVQVVVNPNRIIVYQLLARYFQLNDEIFQLQACLQSDRQSDRDQALPVARGHLSLYCKNTTKFQSINIGCNCKFSSYTRSLLCAVRHPDSSCQLTSPDPGEEPPGQSKQLPISPPNNQSGTTFTSVSNRCPYSPELERTLHCDKWFHNLAPYHKLKSEVEVSFSASNNADGPLKRCSFCYLLIDPRSLPANPSSHDSFVLLKLWPSFLEGIFYVGKGQGTRPYSHLKQALKDVTGPDLKTRQALKDLPPDLKTRQASKDLTLDLKTRQALKDLTLGLKTRQILEIWEGSAQVLCIYVCRDLVSAEALTYEAAILDALTLDNVTNKYRGAYYGLAHGWASSCKRCLGVYLLGKALEIYVTKGEKHLRLSLYQKNANM